MEKLLIDTYLCSITQLDANTFYLWDKSGQIPTPHYYKTLKAAQKKNASIIAKASK